MMQPPNPDPRKSSLEIILVDQADELMAAAKTAADALRSLGTSTVFWQAVAEAERISDARPSDAEPGA